MPSHPRAQNFTLATANVRFGLIYPIQRQTNKVIPYDLTTSNQKSNSSLSLKQDASLTHLFHRATRDKRPKTHQSNGLADLADGQKPTQTLLGAWRAATVSNSSQYPLMNAVTG